MFYWTQPPRSAASSDNGALTSFERVSLKPLGFWSLLSSLLLINNCSVQPLKVLIHISYNIRTHFQSSSAVAAVQVGSSTHTQSRSCNDFLPCKQLGAVLCVTRARHRCPPGTWSLQLAGTRSAAPHGALAFPPPSSAVLPGLSLSEQRQFWMTILDVGL